MKYGHLIILVLLTACCGNRDGFPELQGPFLGQALPGSTPELFAPGIISDGMPNRDVAVSPDGNSICVGIHSADFRYASILETRLENGHWTKPEIPEFASDPRYVYLEPAFSTDGKRLFFFSTMPGDTGSAPADEDIWFVEKQPDGSWGKPVNPGPPVNSDGSEFFPSLTRDGSIWFTRSAPGDPEEFIYRCQWKDGAWQEAVRLPGQINCGRARFNVYVSPDEDFAVVPSVGMPDALGGADYYIVFRNQDGSWREPLNMGPQINAARGGEWSFYMSPDRKVIFFMATRPAADRNPEKLTASFFNRLTLEPENGNPDIYWMDAAILDTLRMQSSEGKSK